MDTTLLLTLISSQSVVPTAAVLKSIFADPAMNLSELSGKCSTALPKSSQKSWQRIEFLITDILPATKAAIDPGKFVSLVRCNLC